MVKNTLKCVVSGVSRTCEVRLKADTTIFGKESAQESRQIELAHDGAVGSVVFPLP
jgi:hypothetical protein